MSSPTNPYIIGKPVTGSEFFGRNSAIQAIKYILCPPSHTSVVIFGQRKTGKTSLLLQLTETLEAPFVPIYVDLAGRARQPLSQVLFEMAAAAAEKAGMAPPTLEHFQPAPAIFEHSFLPALNQALGDQRQIIFLLDEFEQVDTPASLLPSDAAGRLLANYVHQLLGRGHHTSFIFTTGRRMNELSSQIRTGPYARLNRTLSVLTPPQARRLVLKEGAPAYKEEAVQHIIDSTRGHPHLIQLLCHTIYDATEERWPQEINVSDVKAAANVLLDRRDTDLFHIWESVPPAEQIVLAAAAERILGPDALIIDSGLDSALSEVGVSATTENRQCALENLVAWQMMEQKKGGYGFFIEFFRRWILHHFPLDEVKTTALSQLDPELRWLYLEGYYAYNAGMAEDAVNKIIEILAVAPRFVQAHLLLGKIHTNNGRPAQAVKSLEALYSFNPTAAAGGLAAALVSLGLQQEENQACEEALVTYKRVLEIQPRNSVALSRCAALTTVAGEALLRTTRTAVSAAEAIPASAAASAPTPALDLPPEISSTTAARRSRRARGKRQRARLLPVLVGLLLLLLACYGLYGKLPGQLDIREYLAAYVGEGIASTPTRTSNTAKGAAAGTEPVSRQSVSPTPTVPARDLSATPAESIPPTSSAPPGARITGGDDLAAGFAAPTASPTAAPARIPPVTPITGSDPVTLDPSPEPPATAAQPGEVNVTGPATLLPLFEVLGRAFSDQEPDFKVSYSTGTFPDSLVTLDQGSAQVALIPRRPSVYELVRLSEVAHLLPLPQVDPINIVAHPELPLTNLTQLQLRDIFSGAVTNWREVGGPDVPIKVVIPDQISGTGQAFQQQVLGASPLLTGENTTIASTDAEVYPLVADQPGTIGLTTAQPADIPTAKTVLIDNVAPTFENVESGTYPISRPVYLAVSKQLTPESEAWIDFIYSPEGQQVIELMLRDGP